MKYLNLLLVIIIVGLFIAEIAFYLTLKSNLEDISASFSASLVQKKSPLENFAKCLTEKGVKFYGAAWDGHTQNQKEMFGEAAKYLSYIECMEQERQEMSFQCQLAEIKAFPTWEFTNGKKLIGEVSLKKLSELSGCNF